MLQHLYVADITYTNFNVKGSFYDLNPEVQTGFA